MYINNYKPTSANFPGSKVILS